MARRARGSGKGRTDANREEPETDGAGKPAAAPHGTADRSEDTPGQPASERSASTGDAQQEASVDADGTGPRPPADLAPDGDTASADAEQGKPAGEKEARPAADQGEGKGEGEDAETPTGAREDKPEEPVIALPDERADEREPVSTSSDAPADSTTPAEAAETDRTEVAEASAADAAPTEGASPAGSEQQPDAQTGQTTEQAETDPQAGTQTQQEETDRTVPPAPVMPPPPPPRRGGFMAPFLGGIMAAGLGAGAVLYFLPEGWQPASDPALERRIAALEDRPAPDTATDVAETVASSVDSALQPLEDRIAALENRIEEVGASADAAPALPAETETRLDALETAVENTRGDAAGNTEALASLAERLDDVEAALAAVPEPELTAEDLSRLAERVTALEDTDGTALDDRIDAAVAEAMAEARAEQDTRAREISDAADELARVEQRVAARAALARLTAAAESGGAEPAALQDIAAFTDPPEGVDAFADGLPTLAALQDSFPDLARAALLAAPPPPDAGVGDRVIGFLRQQTGARSLAPRDGDDPDALLSRAESQLRLGQLADTLETLQALPAESAAVLSEWKAQAQTRLTALQGLESLRDDLGTE